MNIVKAPNSVLSEIAKPVPLKQGPKLDRSILDLIEEMKKTLAATRNPEGVGLAAPQVGKTLQIFVAKPTSKSPFLVFINPVIKKKSDELVPLRRPKKNSSKSGLGKLEGCLSLTNIWGIVLRSPFVDLEYIDETAKTHRKKFSGFLATIIQHETDHLNGILFPKRVLEQKGKLYKSHKNEKNEDEFEEIEL